MVPRVDMFAFDVTTSLSEAAQTALASGHSRVPVFDESIDNIIGLLYVKDLLRLLVEENHTITSLRDVIRPAYFVPEAKKVDELLNEMQARGVHMVVVVDEYGGTAGLVTLEDIVEEIVGEIRDEYDQAEEHPVQIIGPQEFVFHGRIDLEDVNELLGTHFTKDLADTLGGYIYAEFNRVPANGDTFEVEDWLLTIEQVNGRRIRRVRAVPKPIRATNEEKANDAER
jgi:CBS domain containing-hemolysin-like protein